ncbi:MAG: hypothetical protein Unbinned4350contig1002_25 [Prokaryotic dsDNA virus sp.]|nr:MAG: hypothetical protein Unbinned4350contig1002_25 [Prokaryotic dsDNA virus sp.]|tara:strand:- start:1420 stop:1674 length:255 start_codon:yes stop_codon:yes gene_type:complete
MTKIVSFFVGIVGAVSAFFAMVALRRLQRKEAQVELLKARQEAEAKNKEKEAEIEEEITVAVSPVELLTDSKEDREKLAALLDE